MENDTSLNVQNGFFNQARKDRARVTIHLTTGQTITGLVKSFDRFALLIDTRQGDQIVFKHAISTVTLSRPGDEPARSGSFMDIEGKKEP